MGQRLNFIFSISVKNVLFQSKTLFVVFIELMPSDADFTTENPALLDLTAKPEGTNGNGPSFMDFLLACFLACMLFLKFISGATPTNSLTATMAASHVPYIV